MIAVANISFWFHNGLLVQGLLLVCLILLLSVCARNSRKQGLEPNVDATSRASTVQNKQIETRRIRSLRWMALGQVDLKPWDGWPDETSPKTDTEGGTPPGAGLEAGGEDKTPPGARASQWLADSDLAGNFLFANLRAASLISKLSVILSVNANQNVAQVIPPQKGHLLCPCVGLCQKL